MLSGGAISWKSAKQSEIATSTMSAEFMACHEATNHAIWLRNYRWNRKTTQDIL